MGTVYIACLQSHFFAINKFLRDHRRRPFAVGELLRTLDAASSSANTGRTTQLWGCPT
jgi:hypothetical protein